MGSDDSNLGKAETDRAPLSLSLLIPAKRVSDTTVRSIKRILGFELDKNLEVILLLDNQLPATPSELEALLMDPRFRLIGGDSPSRGAAWARNTLAKEALGDVLVFADADADVPINFILAAQESDAELRPCEVWVPAIYPQDRGNVIARFFSQFVLSPNRVGGFLIAPSTVFALRRGDWTALGGFSERFPSAGGEDWEWMLRNYLKNPGFSVTFDPRFQVPHANPTSLRGLIDRAHRYGKAAPLLEDHFTADEKLKLFPPAPEGYVAKLKRVVVAFFRLAHLPPVETGSKRLVEWRGRMFTTWSRRDLLPSAFLLVVFSTVYRFSRKAEIRRFHATKQDRSSIESEVRGGLPQ